MSLNFHIYAISVEITSEKNQFLQSVSKDWHKVQIRKGAGKLRRGATRLDFAQVLGCKLSSQFYVAA